MSVAFADSFYFLALLNRRDRMHVRAQQIASGRDFRALTTRAVLIEVADALAGTRTRAIAADYLADLERLDSVEIVPLSEELYARGFALYCDRPDKEWSLTDCISFVVMGDRGIREALTGDRHFAQAGFVPLLAQS